MSPKRRSFTERAPLIDDIFTYRYTTNFKHNRAYVIGNITFNYSSFLISDDSLVREGIRPGSVLTCRLNFERSELATGKLVLFLKPPNRCAIAPLVINYQKKEFILLVGGDARSYGFGEITIAGLVVWPDLEE